MTGYEQLKGQLASLNQLIESLARSKARWEQTATALKAWEEEDSVSNRVLWDIDEFARGTISGEVLDRLKRGLEEQRKDVARQQQEAQSEIRQLKKSRAQAVEELEQLKIGNKAYPRELDEARTILQNRLYQETGKSVAVEILADLGGNQFYARYNGQVCTAIYNFFTGCFYVDDLYGIVSKEEFTC